MTIERVVGEVDLESLPQPVQRYLRYSGVVGRPWIDTVLLQQSGRFRTGRDRPWLPLQAVQEYETDPPSFFWKARFKVAGLPLLRAQDSYGQGHGQMMGRLAGLVTLFDVRGKEMDQGALLRYLSEMIWFPTAFLGENITWQAVDDASADVSLTDAGRTVTGRMFFDPEGRPLNFTARRYRTVGDGFSLDQWSTPITGYGPMAGLNLPLRGQAVWNLPEGDLVYADVVIEDIRYNGTAG